MKIEKSNNPAAVGALVLVLVLIVGRILWMVFGQGGPVAAAATVSANSPTPTAAVARAAPTTAGAPAPEAIETSPAVTTITTRNPFSVAVRPALAASRPGGLPQCEAAHRADKGAGVVPLTSMLPFPVRPRPGISVKRLQAPHGLAALPPHLSTAQVQAEALLTLKLTATVGGTEPSAIVQTTDPEPVILHVGDSLDGMHVLAVHEQDVVFARGNGFWTLPLQSAADGVAADAAAVTTLPPTPQSVISVAPAEEKTDDQE